MRRLTKHIFPEGNRKKEERKELEEASRVVQLRYRQGALYFDIIRPTKMDNYIRAQVHRYTDGEDRSQVQDVSGAEKGFVSAGHASFGQLAYFLSSPLSGTNWVKYRALLEEVLLQIRRRKTAGQEARSASLHGD
jgi:hypothetical protein